MSCTYATMYVIIDAGGAKHASELFDEEAAKWYQLPHKMNVERPWLPQVVPAIPAAVFEANRARAMEPTCCSACGQAFKLGAQWHLSPPPSSRTCITAYLSAKVHGGVCFTQAIASEEIQCEGAQIVIGVKVAALVCAGGKVVTRSLV